MKTFSKEKSKKIRNTYIDKFLKTSSTDYENGKISNNGYFWEDFKVMNLITEEDGLEFISKQEEIYLFVDIYLKHEIVNIKSVNNDIISMSCKEFLEKMNEFPDDIYIFNESFDWTIALTHENNLDNTRFCLIQK